MTKESKRAHSTVVEIHQRKSGECMEWYVFVASACTSHDISNSLRHAIRDTRFYCFPSPSLNIKRQQMLGSHRGGAEDPLVGIRVAPRKF